MKKTRIAATLLALSIAMLSTVALVQATLLVTPKGNIWQFSPIEYSGNDITEIEAYYYTTADPLTPVSIEPLKVIYTDNLVTLVFKPSDLPSEEVDTTGVTVHVGGNIYIESGPGFAWGRTR